MLVSRGIWVFFLHLSVTVATICCSSCPAKTAYVDLTYSLGKDTIFFPGQKRFSLNRDYDGVNKSGIWYSAFSFCMGEHGGTHLDAPYHFNPNGWTIEKIPPTHLIDVSASIIDVQAEVERSTDPGAFEVEVQHLISHERMNGPIISGGIVLIHTGWGKYWPDQHKYLGWQNETGDEGSSLSLNFPGLSGNAAKWLADERQIVGIGIDTPSVDPGNTKTFKAHIVLAERQIYNIENVANLHNLMTMTSQSTTGCDIRLFIMPLKIIGATGAPARILGYCKPS